MRNLKAAQLKYVMQMLICLVLFFVSEPKVFSQISSVTTIQNLNFGAFSQGSSGGTIILSTNGDRSTTGTVVPLNLGTAYFQAIIEVEAAQGTVISILNGPDATLTGTNGGTMILHIGNSDPASPFINNIAPPGKTQVSIGGTLSVGNSIECPPGLYSGTFFVTFNNE